MDRSKYPFDIATYNWKFEIEENYSVKRKYWKIVHLVVENISIEIMQRQTKD